MKTKYTIALSMLAGMAAGAVAVQSLHAQAKSPVYMIALNEVTDADRYAREYVPPAQASVKTHGGVYVAAGLEL
jgi:tryptophan synthase alpha subunit